jgi:hypothetical protein
MSIFYRPRKPDIVKVQAARLEDRRKGEISEMEDKERARLTDASWTAGPRERKCRARGFKRGAHERENEWETH